MYSDGGEMGLHGLAQPGFERGLRMARDEQQPFARPRPVGRGGPSGDKGTRRRRQRKAQHPFYAVRFAPARAGVVVFLQ